MGTRSDGNTSFLHRVLLASGAVLALIAVLYFIQHVARVLLLIFTAILFAVFLDAGASILRKRVNLPQMAAVGIVTLLVVGFLVGMSWLLGPRIAEQMSQLADRIPEAVAQIQEAILGQAWGQEIVDRAPDPGQVVPANSDILGRITGVFSTALSGIVNTGLILVIGFYLAVNPRLYINSAVRLVPKPRRQRAYEVIGSLGHALRWWLVGQLAEMVIIGVLTTAGFLLIGLPLAFTLGLIAGLLAFIPYLGPILSVIPALLVGLAEGPTMLLYVLIVYGVVQTLESNVITPVIQKKAVSLPPALLISSQILMGFLAGFIGIVIATPLTVAVIVIVQMVYVEDLLKDQVKLMGTSSPEEEASAEPSDEDEQVEMEEE